MDIPYLIIKEFSSGPLSTVKTAIEILNYASPIVIFIYISGRGLKKKFEDHKNKRKKANKNNKRINLIDYGFFGIYSLKPRKLRIKKHEWIMGCATTLIIVIGLIYILVQYIAIHDIPRNSAALSFNGSNTILLVSKNKIQSTSILNPLVGKWSISRTDCKKMIENKVNKPIKTSQAMSEACEYFQSADFDKDFQSKLEEDLRNRPKIKYLFTMLFSYGILIITYIISKAVRRKILLTRVMQHYKIFLITHKIKKGEIKLAHRSGLLVKPTEE